MLDFDDHIAVGVSGGKDSVGLLYILAKMEKRRPEARLVALTIDEGIHGYRDEALKIADENCQQLGVEHVTVSFKQLFGVTIDKISETLHNRPTGEPTVCAYCGVLRRRALNSTASKLGASKLATAHTLDDETQTVLMNLLNGDILRLAKEKPVTDEVHPRLVPRIKPFCRTPERESALYAFLKGIRFQNRPCPYAHDALRNDARFMINRLEEKHPGMKHTILGSIEQIRPALESLTNQQKLASCNRCGEATTGKVCRVCTMLDHLRNR